MAIVKFSNYTGVTELAATREVTMHLVRGDQHTASFDSYAARSIAQLFFLFLFSPVLARPTFPHTTSTFPAPESNAAALVASATQLSRRDHKAAASKKDKHDGDANMGDANMDVDMLPSPSLGGRRGTLAVSGVGWSGV